MESSEIAFQQEILRDDLIYLYEHAPLSKRDFVEGSYGMIGNLVRNNKRNPLIQNTVRRYPDLILRGHVILSMLYGLFSLEPNRLSILRDFVGMLDKDLEEEELRVFTYAKSKNGGSFFPKLFEIFQMIREIYGREHFSRKVLPTTPYRAYTLFVLNHSELLEKDLSLEELFGHLSADESRMTKIFATLSNEKA